MDKRYYHPTYRKYFVFSDGTVIGARGKPLSKILHHTGYNVFTLDYKQVRWHRFVWECYHNQIADPELVVHHVDGDKLNNSINNLELVTSQENTIHAFDAGLRVSPRGGVKKSSKLTNEMAKSLILDLVGGMSNSVAGEKYGVHSGYISLVRHKRRWVWLWEELGI